MSSSQTSNVLVVGGTGKTGESIVNALLDDKRYHVTVTVRPGSESKPTAQSFQHRGAKLRVLDLSAAPPQPIQDILAGIDIVISTVNFRAFSTQTPLIDAAKAAGVKRFIPCDFGTACVPGVRGLYDEKLTYHEHIKRVGLGHTFIDVGWWYQISLPALTPELAEYRAVHELGINSMLFDNGDVKNALTDRRDIGKFVARIISDDRTLNRYVFIWDEEWTQHEIFDLVKEVTGKEVPIIRKTGQDLLELAKSNELLSALWEYLYSIWVRGDNVVENAKKPEYGLALDARELYPDIKVRGLRDYAVEVLGSK